ncbi:MAG: DegT/DnrJ/EryC1/StrS family aminotransferase [Chloroflexota bacterium]
MDKLAILGGNPVRKGPFPMEMPQINQADIDEVVDVLRKRCLSIFSSTKIVEFENEFAEFAGTKYAVALTSCTATIQTSLAAASIGLGDEVIVPVYTYMATVNGVLLQNATPVFVDTAPNSFNLDVSKVEERITSKTKAILVVDLFGNPAPRNLLMDLAQKYGLFLIEDCAQSTGAEIHGQRVGRFGIGCHSFGEIKNITSAEGGMITTNDPEIARKARIVRHEGEVWRHNHATTIGQSPSRLVDMIEGIDYEMIGHNYRMNALQAALGNSQLKRIDQINKRRINIAESYNQALQNIPQIQMPKIEKDAKPVYNRFAIILDPEFHLSRNAFLAALISEGVPAGVYYPKPLNRAHIFSKNLGEGRISHPFIPLLESNADYSEEFPNAELVCKQQVLLPCYPEMQIADAESVSNAIEKVLKATADPSIAELLEQKVSSIRAEYFGQFFTLSN